MLALLFLTVKWKQGGEDECLHYSIIVVVDCGLPLFDILSVSSCNSNTKNTRIMPTRPMVALAMLRDKCVSEKN